MGITKNHIHTEDQIAIASLFKALGHPARIAIIENLLEHDNLNCNDLRKHIQLSQSSISKHIKELFDIGILAVCVVGNNAFYQVVKASIEIAISYTDKIIDKISSIIIDPISFSKRLKQELNHNLKCVSQTLPANRK